MPVSVKRVYEKPRRTDGTRVLVDRLWPRGLTKEAAAIDAWLRELAPSNELRQWFHQRPDARRMFRNHYLKELAKPDAASQLQELYDLAGKRSRLTLLFASRNQEFNNATVLKDLLDGMRKPPTGTGPGAVRVIRERQVKRMPRGH